jgi:hypothetical protein
MNRIVKAHYPISALPEDLRQGLDPAADVTVIIEETERPDEIMSIEELFAARRPPFRSADGIIRDLRKQRDAWDD